MTDVHINSSEEWFYRVLTNSILLHQNIPFSKKVRIETKLD